MLEDEAGDMIGIEVKAAATVITTDFRGLRKIADATGKAFRAGWVLYDGDRLLPFGERMAAAPLSVCGAIDSQRFEASSAVGNTKDKKGPTENRGP